MHRLLLLALYLLFTAVAHADAKLFTPIAVKPVFLSQEEAFAFSWSRVDSGSIVLRWAVAPGYYLYRDRMAVRPLGKELEALLPPGEPHTDQFFGEVQIYRQQAQIVVPKSRNDQLQISWQGCADAGLCYSPVTITIDLSAGQVMTADGADDEQIAWALGHRSLPISIAVFFGLGILLAFTPCSLPMLPILASVVTGSRSGTRALGLAATYVFCSASVYAVIGVAAGFTGGSLQAALQQPLIVGAFSLLFVALALPMFGVFELQLPESVRDWLQRLTQKSSGGKVLGAAGLGVVSGLLIGPCMTAPLAGALLYVAQSGNVAHGGAALFAMGVGMGLPLLLIVIAGRRFIPTPGAWMERVKTLFGFLFLSSAVFVARPLIDGPIWVACWSSLAIAFGGWLVLATRDSSYKLLRRVTGSGIAAWGLVLMFAAFAGAHNPLKPLSVLDGMKTSETLITTVTTVDELDRALKEARSSGQWVLADVYADWCVACKVMDREVFVDTEVIEALSDVRKIKIDITESTPASRTLLKRFDVLGPPTLLWLGPDGKERRASRITGGVGVETLLSRWNGLPR